MPKEKNNINVVVIGHVDSGKSTTTGHLIYKCGGIDERSLRALEKEAALANKGSFAFAWILDKIKASRESGMTIKTSLNRFETPNYQVTIIDAPGHKDFVKNMTTGTSQADFAMLMISAQMGEFEAGISEEGQTKEHALLAYTLGIKQVIVVVNKMDQQTIKYSKERFDEIVNEAGAFLKRIGFTADRVQFVPVSGWTGENLVEPSPNLGWWKGPTLLEAIDHLPCPARPVDRPLRLTVSECYNIKGAGVVAAGRVEAGVMRVGAVVRFSPGDFIGEVKTIEKHHEKLTEAIPGDNIGFTVRGLEMKHVWRGQVVSEAKNEPARECDHFVAQIVVLNHPNGFSEGYSPVLDIYTNHIACHFEQIASKIDRRTGKPSEDTSKILKNNEAALVKIRPIKPLVVEKFADFPPLGRFAVRDMNRTVAVGVIKEVVRKEPAKNAK